MAARAQTGPGIPSVPTSNTPGIKIGEGRLHFFFDYEARFDSAAGFFLSDGSLKLAPEFLNHFRPGLSLQVPANWVDLYLGGFVDYVWYTGAITPGTQSASRLEANANLDVAFNRNGVVEVDISDLVSRSDRTRAASIGVGVLALSNQLNLAVPIRPGGGALEITPRGAYQVAFFQSISGLPPPGCTDLSCDPGQVGLLNYQDFQGGLQLKWKFLPKTAVLIDSSYDAQRYLAGAASGSPPASLFRIVGGLSGLLTSRLAVVVKGGWAKDFGPSQGEGFIAQAEGTYLLTNTVNFKAGYQRSIDPVPLYGTFRDDRVYAEADALLAGVLTLRLYSAYDWLAFFNASNRLDHALIVDLGPQYQVVPWFLISAGYVYTLRDSNDAAASFNYRRHEVYLRLTFTF